MSETSFKTPPNIYMYILSVIGYIGRMEYHDLVAW